MSQQEALHPSNCTKTIINELEGITRQGYDFPRVFGDWLILMTAAFCKQEAMYLEVMGRYRNTGAHGTRPADYFANALAALMLANQTKPYDYLGDIFVEHVTNGTNGQFFTPDILCDMMARMMLSDLQDDQTVCDPACGSGRILLHATEQNRFATFYGVDIDQRCAQMTALNLLFRNVNAYVVWGNTLSLECWGGYTLRRSPLGGEMFQLKAEDATSLLILETIKEQAQEQTLSQNTPQQLVLF